MRLLLLSLLLLSAGAAVAQTPGSCTLGTAQGDLDVGDVFARVFNTGSLFFGNTTTSGDGYLVPQATARSPIFAAGLWVGGRVGGEVRFAGSRYDSFTFWPGPLGTDGAPPANCAAFDRIYRVSRADVAAYEGGGTPTADLAEWPVALGADVIDGDGTPGNYDLAGGDRPKLYGDEDVFWVMNDVGGPRPLSATPNPIGIEVQVTGAAFDSPDAALNQMTLYRYRLVKRGPGTLADARMGLFMDPDVGNAVDDYVASDPARGLGIAYNADNNDEGPAGYGTAPPAVGVDFLDGTSAMMYFENLAGGPTTDPQTGAESYNYLLGLWKDGTPMREGGNGYGPQTGAVTTYAFSGDPVTGAFWSEGNTNGSGASNPPGDRRLVAVAQPFSLAPGETRDIVVALPFAQGTDRFDSITRLRATDDAIQTAYEAGLLFPVAGEATPPSADGVALSAPRPNPTAGGAEVSLTLPAAGAARVVVIDVLGREVAVLHEGTLAAGATTLRVPSGLAPGVYAVLAEAAGVRVAQRVTVTR